MARKPKLKVLLEYDEENRRVHASARRGNTVVHQTFSVGFHIYTLLGEMEDDLTETCKAERRKVKSP